MKSGLNNGLKNVYFLTFLPPESHPPFKFYRATFCVSGGSLGNDALF